MISSRKKSPDPEAVLKRLAGLCARSEQCSFDISNKLYRSRLSREERDKILDYLVSNRFVDDTRFARAFANYKVRFSSWGKHKIRLALAAKRIPSSLISEALDNIDPQEYVDALKKLITAKKRELDLSDREQRAKLYRQLLSRGFESDLISTFL